MPQQGLAEIVRFLQATCAMQGACDLSDGELLERFLDHREESAFTFLVRRHGPMILGVGQRILRDLHQAEDVLQATFLVLARRSKSIGGKRSIGGWLHGVAQNIALKARAKMAARRNSEKEARNKAASQPLDDLTCAELRSALDEAIAALPEKHRAPIVLCYLEGKSHAQAAKELGWPKNTVTNRLARARELLRRQLEQRGVTLAAAALATSLAEMASAAPMPAILTMNTVKAAALVAAGKAVAGSCISAGALALAGEAVRGMMLAKGKLVVVVMALGLAAGGAGWIACGGTARIEEPVSSVLKSRLPAPTSQESGPAKKEVSVATDQYGDPLPEGAVARLGVKRFRYESGPSYPPTALIGFTLDGKSLIAATDSGIILWDAATGREKHRLAVRRPQHGQGVAVSPDGKTLAITGENLPDENEPKISLYDLHSGKKMRTLSLSKKTGRQYTAHLCFSADGKSLACDNGGRAIVFDVASGQLRVSLGGQVAVNSENLCRIAISPDGTMLAATIDPNFSLQLWDIATGALIRTIHELPAATDEHYVRALAFAPDGKMLAFADSKRIFLCDPTTGKALGQLEQGVAGNDYLALAFSRDGKKLISCNWGAVHVWDASTGTILKKLEGLPGRSIVLSPDGARVALVTNGSFVRLWDVTTGKELTSERRGHESAIQSLAYSPDGKTLVSTDEHGSIYLWNPSSKEPSGSLEGKARTLSFSPDGKRLVTTYYPGSELRIWEVVARKEVLTITVPDSVYISSANFSADGRRLIILNRTSHGDDRKYYVRRYDAASGKQERMWNLPEQLWPQFLGADGETVFGEPERGGGLSMYDVVSGQTSVLGAQDEKRALSPMPSPDARVLASGMFGPNADVRLWEAMTRKEIVRLHGHEGSVSKIAWSPDGRIVASGDRRRESWDTAKIMGQWRTGNWDVNQTVRLWDTATGKLLAVFGGFEADITDLTFAPDGASLAGGLRDGTILIWDVSAARRQLPRPAELSAQQLESLWTDLVSDNVGRAHLALWTLAAVSNHSVAFLQSRLKAASPFADQAKIQQWIQDQDSDKFAVRQLAAKELAKGGEQARELIRKALKENNSLEAQIRLTQILKSIPEIPARETVRTVRAIMALERIGSSKAQGVLETLGRGAPGARETEEAKVSLERLAQRGGGMP